MSILPWPGDDVEHELESLSQWLRSFSDCPSEVRIREEEGGFERPMFLFRHTSAGYTDGGRLYYQVRRGLNLMWYGSTEGPDLHYEKNHALSWVLRALTRENDVMRGLVPIYDFGGTVPAPTEDWIMIQDDTVDVTPRRDQYGFWTISTDMAYIVERSPDEILDPVTGDPVPIIIGVEHEYVPPGEQ